MAAGSMPNCEISNSSEFSFAVAEHNFSGSVPLAVIVFHP